MSHEALRGALERPTSYGATEELLLAAREELVGGARMSCLVNAEQLLSSC